jgi:hypothetical protein
MKDRNKNIDQQYKKIRRKYAKDSFNIEFPEWYLLPFLPGCHQLVRDQKSAKHKKQVHTTPSESNKRIVHPVRMLEYRIVIKKNKADASGRK